jgi:hypothetical protein
MTDPRDNPSPQPQTGAVAAGDPLSGLYRMSRTAGLASSDYQAVNAPSVVSFLSGLLSFIASFELVLLVVPLTALVLGVIAIKQIRGSNGTQTGLPLAVLGIVAALALGGWAGSGKAREAARTREDREELTQSIARLGELIAGEKFEDAYTSLFSKSFRDRVSLAEFSGVWRAMRMHPALGALKGMSSNRLFNFEVEQGSQLRLAIGQISLDYEKAIPADRPQIIFTRRDNRWLVEQIPSLFPPPVRAPGQVGGPG